MSITYTTFQTYLGVALLAASETGISHLELGSSAQVLESNFCARFPEAVQAADSSFLHRWAEEVTLFFESPTRAMTLPLHVQGTPFQKRIWQILQSIPCGTTLTYHQLAAQSGNPKAARAVAQACAANQIAVLIPCHRIVRSDGSLSGYRWGTERKRQLLEYEKDAILPKKATK